MRTFVIQIIVPTLLLLTCSLIINAFDIDRNIAHLVIEPSNQWPGNSSRFFLILYYVAPVPGVLLAVGSLLYFFLSFSIQQFGKNRQKALFIVLLAALGPGLLVNVVCKDHIGRPRPREIIEFGGQHEFVQIGKAGKAGTNSSFPSGHASIAFFLMAPWFIYRHKRKKIARYALLTGLSFGLLVGLARIVQGGHFLSDVIWAGGMVYLSGEFLLYAFRLSPLHQNNQLQFFQSNNETIKV